MTSGKMNCSILEYYIVGNVGLTRTLRNTFIFNKWQIFYLNTSRSMFQILYFYAVLLLQKAPLTPAAYMGCKYSIYFTLLQILSDIVISDILNCSWSAILIKHM